MSNLPNLRKFAYPEGETATKEQADPKSILDNSNKKSNAVKLVKNLMYASGAGAALFTVAWVAGESFDGGDGLLYTSLWNLVTHDSATIVFNLMIRCICLTFFLYKLTGLAEKITCPICGNYFTGKVMLNTNYHGYDYNRDEYKDYNLKGDKVDVTDESYTYHFEQTCQCKHCSSIYATKISKTMKNRSVYDHN